MNTINNKQFIFIVSILCLALFQPSFAAKKSVVTNIQTTITSGDNNGMDETYYGVWLASKKSIGLSRNSIFTVKGKIGAKSYKQNSAANSTDIDLQALYLYQPSAGYFSPLYVAKLIYLNEERDRASSSIEKTSLSFTRYQPLSNTLDLGFGYKYTREENSSTNSLSANLDYFHNLKTTFYINLNMADQEVDDTSAAMANTSTLDASSLGSYIASSHLPGEPGYVAPTLPSNNVLDSTASVNSYLSLGAVYRINSHHSIDIALFKQFYDTEEMYSDTNSNMITTRNIKSDATYIAFDYFYTF